MKRILIAALLAAAAATPALAQSKSELVQKLLQLQQPEIEQVARTLVERPAAQMMQQAGIVLQTQIPPEKREAIGKAIEADVRKYVEEATPLVRDRAIRIAPSTIGVMLEQKFSDDELKQIIAWYESPVSRKYQQLGAEVRNEFVQKVIADARPVIDPKLRALDGRMRVDLGLPPAGSAPSASTPAAK